MGLDSRLDGSIWMSEGYSQGALFLGREGGEGDSMSVREKSVREKDSSEEESSDLQGAVHRATGYWLLATGYWLLDSV